LDIDLGEICIRIDIGITIRIPIRPPVWPDPDGDPYAATAMPVEAMSAVKAMPTTTPRVPRDGTGEKHRG